MQSVRGWTVRRELAMAAGLREQVQRFRVR